MSSLRLIYSTSHNPLFNLAVEETLFHHLPPKQRVLFLWRNQNTVVIGRAQNPWKECNLRKMNDDGITLARRSSGGGAVFHDLGNTCFTFMAGKPDYDKSVSTQIMIDALSLLGVNAQASGRNDLVITRSDGERKISGSAYRERADRGFHHGTILINTNMTKLANYLNPDPKKLQAKGISSVRARVVNLQELDERITHDTLCHAIQQIFFDYYNEQAEPEFISPDTPPALPFFAEQHEKQQSWAWNFGHAPAFNHTLDERFSWGGVTVHLDIEKGTISRSQIFTDSLTPAPFEALANALIGQPYKPEQVRAIANTTFSAFPEQIHDLNQFTDWLTQQLQ